MVRQDVIKSFVNEHKRHPNALELAKLLNVSERTAMHELALYAAAKQKPELNPPKQKIPSKQAKQKLSKVLFLKIALLLISALSFGLSVYFTGLWFFGKFHIVVASGISFSMVLFMVISPQAFNYSKSKFVRSLICLCFSIALIFSMASTVAGQYNKTSAKLETTGNAHQIFNHYASRQNEIKQLIEDERKNKSIHSNTLERLSATNEDRIRNYQQIATERNYIKRADARIDEYVKKLEELNGKIETRLIAGSVNDRQDFFGFISLLLGLEKDFVEFIASTMPAVFIDAISALSLNLALFIKEK